MLCTDCMNIGDKPLIIRECVERDIELHSVAGIVHLIILQRGNTSDVIIERT